MTKILRHSVNHLANKMLSVCLSCFNVCLLSPKSLNISNFCAKGDVIKVNKAFIGRVTLPGYSANPLNATMEISSLRTNDSGTYHCQVVMGNDYERDTVPLVVSGK